ncbi:hypothetical protein QBC41DRAFT_50141 [Cercophora samala]|uniref:Ankyrin repeat protein n=1 Tax=Cercophora samala TaxID=330535 RepID=A0AA39YV43_9PEZI|nr:hypothetical protein QBC41DRAFT_50141 [Cercophora samala]
MSRFVDAMTFARNTANDGYCRLPHVQCQPKIDGTITSSKISLVVPFIDFESEGYLMRHKTPHDTLGRKQKRLKLLEEEFGQYDGSIGIQLPETLDQAYYEGSASLNERNTDQVVYKWLKDRDNRRRARSIATASQNAGATDTAAHAHGGGNLPIQDAGAPETASPAGTAPPATGTDNPAPGLTNPPVENAETCSAEDESLKLLMVRQLWLWKLDERTILTAIPPRWDSKPKETLFETLMRSLPLHAWSTIHALIQQILLQCVKFPEEFEQAGIDYHILDIFENWIAKQEDDEVALFRRFREFVEKHDKGKDNHIHSSDQESLKIGKEVQIIYELKDALGELSILKQLFTNQKEIAERYHSTCPQGDQSISHESFIQQSRIQAFIDRADRLEANASRVLAAVDHLVTVKQAQSALIMSTLANIEASKSRQLNNFVLLLTAVTIVFTPLAFMLALFALSIEGFPQDDNGEPFYRSSWITGRLFAGELVSLFVISLGFLAIKYSNEKSEESLKHQAPKEHSIASAGRGPLEKLRLMVHRPVAPVAEGSNQTGQSKTQAIQDTKDGVLQTGEVPPVGRTWARNAAFQQPRPRGPWGRLRGREPDEPDLELQEFFRTATT